MMLAIHNPKKTKNPRAKKRRAPKENPVMAKKKKKAKRSKARARKNPSTAKPRRKKTSGTRSSARRRSSSKRNPSRTKGRRRARRRNPDSSGMLKKVAIAAVGAVVAGAAVNVVASLASPSGNTMLGHYGGAAAGVVAGAMVAKKRPELGFGIAAGAVAGLLVPKASALLGKVVPSNLAGMGEVGFASMGAIVHNDREVPRLGMGEVSYASMGEVAYAGMGDIADDLANGANPFEND